MYEDVAAEEMAIESNRANGWLNIAGVPDMEALDLRILLLIKAYAYACGKAGIDHKALLTDIHKEGAQ